MNTRIFRTAAVAAWSLLLAAAVPLAGFTSPTAANATTTTRILTCDLKVTAKPAAYTLSCADANAGWTHVTWSSWGTRSATGHGFLQQNNCTPNCAAGKLINYRATVILSKVVSTKHYGVLFSRATIRYHVGTKVATEVFGLID